MSEEMKPGAGGLLIVERATTGSGEFIGLRLTLPESDKITLVFADQKAMPGFRYGKEFIPDFGETVRYADELSQLREELAHAEQWRDLALQFDRHRMNAMALIKAVASGKAGAAECEVFASVPPIPGHEITAEVDQLRARIAALESQQAASVGGEDTRRTLGYSVRGNRYMIKATRGEIPSPPYDDRQIIELVDRAALSPAGGGVVMPDRKQAAPGDVLSFQSEGWNACLGEVARLNAKPSEEA